MNLQWHLQDGEWVTLFPEGFYRKAIITMGDSGLWVRLFENGEVIRTSFPFQDHTAARHEAFLLAEKEGWVKVG